MKWVVVMLLLAPVVLGCVVPRDGMMIRKSVQFCTDVYFLDKGISIVENNVNLDCNGAVLKSWTGGKGISMEHVSNITVSKCRIVNYNIGLYARNATNIYLEDNHLVRNKIGTRFVLVKDSATFNHDVSLQTAFEVMESENNVLSLTNKPVKGDFCGSNFCNEQRNAVTLFVQPKTTVPQLQNWLVDQLTGKKPIQKFYDYVFGQFSTAGVFLT